MNVTDFDYDLPPGVIAQRPAPRGTSRMMVLDRGTGSLPHSSVTHRSIADLPELLRQGDVLVLNDTRVIPARLFGVDSEGRNTEFLLVWRTPEAEVWECLVKPGRGVKPGRRFDFGEGLSGIVLARPASGRYLVAFSCSSTVNTAQILSRIGTAPLPPYIHRPGGKADERDAADYQTVFARDPGAIAAPTAGLHFTPELLATLETLGVRIAFLTLHVGLGTFKPVKAERVEEHVMEIERGLIPGRTADEVNEAKAEGRRVVAVGTTSVRALESSARSNGGRVAPGTFETALFLTPGADFLTVDALLTNFHLPRSTLLMLVSAFAGRERILAAYREAIGAGYRFFSYGDAMFIQ